MNKNSFAALIALAALSAAAQAQSSVTVYGIVDMSVRKMNNGQSTLTVGAD